MQTTPDTDTLTSLDFDFRPICDVTAPKRRSRIGRFFDRPRRRSQPCDKPAIWLGIAPCGCAGYSCDPHRWDPSEYMCLNCGCADMHRHQYTWIRL